MFIYLWPESDSSAVTLCGWQDTKIQLLLLVMSQVGVFLFLHAAWNSGPVLFHFLLHFSQAVVVLGLFLLVFFFFYTHKLMCVAVSVTVNMILMHDSLTNEMNELLERAQSLQLEELRETAEVATERVQLVQLQGMAERCISCYSLQKDTSQYSFRSL